MTETTSNLEEKLAIEQLKKGDLDGLEVLITFYQVGAVHAAFLVTGDSELAKDIVQDAFLNAARKIAQFDESRHFRPWFLKSVINASIKAAKQQNRVLSLNDSPDESVDQIARWFIDDGARPDEIIETKETQRVVWDALKQLSPEQRSVVILHHFLGFDAIEITNKMDRPTFTIYWWLRTARNRLREFLNPYWQAEYRERKDGNGE